jgi:hypothetical protein
MPQGITDFARHLVGVHGFDYSRIDEHVFIGTNMCCQFGFNRELLAKGVTADISLEGERVDAPTGVEYFLWLPTVDHQPPSSTALEQGVHAIRLLISQGKKMYIHCKNGHGRAPTLYAAYLISTGMSVDDAIAAIHTQRPSIHLEQVQREALKRFAIAR